MQRDGTVVSTWVSDGSKPFSSPTFAARQINGTTLVADTDNSRVILLSAGVIWELSPAADGSEPDTDLRRPTQAQILADGRVLITDPSKNRVVIAPPPTAGDAQAKAWSYHYGTGECEMMSVSSTSVSAMHK